MSDDEFRELLVQKAAELFESLNLYLGKPPATDMDAWNGWNEAEENVYAWIRKGPLKTAAEIQKATREAMAKAAGEGGE